MRNINPTNYFGFIVEHTHKARYYNCVCTVMDNYLRLEDGITTVPVGLMVEYVVSV